MSEYGRIHTDGSRSGGQPVLLPCPFCGGVQIKAFHHIDRGWGASWHVECVAEECGNSTCHHDTEATAIAAWNKRQPTHSNIFDAGDVQKHTLIVDQDYSSHTVKVKSLDDSQPTQSDALREALWAMPEPYEYLNKDQLKSIRPYVDALRNWKHCYRAVLQEQSK